MMRFQRTQRYGQIEITPRKLRAIEGKPERDRKALAAKLPLLVDVLPEPGPVDVQAEIQSRQRRSDASEQRMRALYARVWRESRRDYFQADATTRAAIREAWAAWTGPITCMYYRYVVDLHTGVQEARSQAFKKAEAESKAQRRAMSKTQPSLF